jgi:hypothetical protein
MCEFTVYLVDGTTTEREMVAKNIFAAKNKNGRIVLLGVSGDSVSVENALIEEVSTMKQELILKKIP